MLYGAEAWALTKKEEQAVLIFGREMCRRIYGAKYGNGEWKSGTNRELEEMSKGEDIVKWIKGQRISWLGHLERMVEDRMPKKIFTQKLERHCSTGQSPQWAVVPMEEEGEEKKKKSRGRKK